MELSELIPENNQNWLIKKGTIMYKNYIFIPAAFIHDDVVYIYLDNKIPNQVTKLIKHFLKNKIDFLFTTPLLNDKSLVKRKGDDWLKSEIITHHFFSYIQSHFFYKFKKINFDLIYYLVKWIEKNDAHVFLKPSFDKIKKEVNKSFYDYYTSSQIYEYDSLIRDDFNNLYRTIKLNMILS